MASFKDVEDYYISQYSGYYFEEHSVTNYAVPIKRHALGERFPHILMPTFKKDLSVYNLHRVHGTSSETISYGGGRVREEWRLLGELGRTDEDLPSLIEKREGNIHHLAWYVNNKRHRNDNPAVQRYGKTGERWWEGPASVVEEEWYCEGVLHRVGGPARITSKELIWYNKGLKHNDTQPAVIDNTGREEWWFKGRLHNFEGKATNRFSPVVVGQKGREDLTFYREWSIFGIPTRYPHVCEEITNKTNPPTTERLYELLEHEDYVVAMLAHHHLPIPFENKPPHTFYDDKKFFDLFEEEFFESADWKLGGLFNDETEDHHRMSPSDFLDCVRKLPRENVTLPFKIVRNPKSCSDYIELVMGDIVWKKDGHIHRDPEEGPAVECLNGRKEYWNMGVLHREGAPAVVTDSGVEYWNMGVLHREGGPAVVGYDKGRIVMQEWYYNGKLHNPHGPARKNIQNSTFSYFINGVPHRIDGPAKRFRNGDKEWWCKGKLHNLAGPAIQYSDGGKEWWVNNYTSYEPELCETVFYEDQELFYLFTLTCHEDYVLRNLAQYRYNERKGERNPASFFNWDSQGEERLTVVLTKTQDDYQDRPHSTEAPAIVHYNGDKEWRVGGLLRREEGDLPTVESGDGTQYWWRNLINAEQEETMQLHRTTGPAIIYPPNVEKTPAHRFVWWWEGETTNENELCEQAVNPHTNPDTLYNLCFHQDVVVRNLALCNPNCPPEGKVNNILETLNSEKSDD